jgi:hypothetical protein
MLASTTAPSLMPRLSAGAHRSPRRGACFKEFASYLAGERWSDHPECTDPVLAALARGVNDGVSDARRDELVHQIPRVIGLRGDDDAIGLIVALRAATAALPVASMDRQHSLAVGILGLCASLDARGLEVPELQQGARRALEDVPGARAWAADHLSSVRRPAGPLTASAALAITRIAAAGIAQACIDDPDTLLIRTLDLAISDAEAQLTVHDRHREPVPA